jgi:hypothetical protein
MSVWSCLRDQRAANHNIKMCNKSFENVEQFRYFETILKNKNYFHKEIMNKLNPENTCYHSVHNLLFLSLLSENIHRNVLYLLYCMGVKLGLLH